MIVDDLKTVDGLTKQSGLATVYKGWADRFVASIFQVPLTDIDGPIDRFTKLRLQYRIPIHVLGCQLAEETKADETTRCSDRNRMHHSRGQ